ncbi:hypothetical protein [Geodermatophilus chilensis]|uniref:hypothetical protein n=1 Tax=Geodermatophilus chilensis TaxID=2035835 RepID=UPI000C26B513|nr:hypothetical protein [Geodermatophilus chilensis]
MCISASPRTTAPAAAPPEPAHGARRARRGLVLAGAAAGAVVLGGAGYAAASYLSGGGPQPEEVLPADTLGFVKLDLDPAAGQKAAVASLLQEFPHLRTGGDDGDLRSALITPLLEDDPWGLSYSDVEPWLGDRMAVAAVPEPGIEAGVAPVVVLAVTDEEAMTDRLGAVEDADFAFAVRDDHVLISQTQETVDRLVATAATLADDEDYTGDLAALDGDQVAVAWADLAGLGGVLGETVPSAGAGFGGQPLTGRVVLGVHAESDALEVEGLTRGATAPTGPVAATEPTRLVLDLSEDTLAALSVSGLGDATAAAWATASGSGVPPEVREQLAALGLDLPDDLRTVLGDDLVLAVVGDVTAPQFGARAVTDDPQGAVQVLGEVLGSPEIGLPVATVPLEDGYVLSTDQVLVDALTEDGGLGDSAAFRAAVADPDTAGVIGFVDLGALVDQFAAQGGDAAAEAERFAALGALGFSATATDDGGRVVLRVTTR